MYRNALLEADIPSEKVTWEDEVIITAGYSRNKFIINPRNIVYLCSNDNYVTIVIIKDKVQNKITLRGTLKAAENELRKNSMFIRCHKCYIVNRCYVDKVTGNNQNMKILLNPSKSGIPVARSKAEFVRKVLKNKF
jgi:DNA-binding LytR/AlgR family response regulator